MEPDRLLKEKESNFKTRKDLNVKITDNLFASYVFPLGEE
jgi:hypothetical protein